VNYDDSFRFSYSELEYVGIKKIQDFSKYSSTFCLAFKFYEIIQNGGVNQDGGVL
jgi:hypothetical protein